MAGLDEAQLEVLLDPALLEGLNRTFNGHGAAWVIRRLEGPLYSAWPEDAPGQADEVEKLPTEPGTHMTSWGSLQQRLVELEAGQLALVCELRKSDTQLPPLIDHAAELVRRECNLRFELQSTLEELISKYEELTVVYDSAETIVQITDLEGVAGRILNEAADLLDVDHASLMLVEDDRLVIKASRGARSDLVGTSLPLDADQISGLVAREGKPVLIEDLATDTQFGRGTREHDNPRSLASVPLKVRDQVLGVLNVNHKRSGEPFNSSDLKLLMALGSLAAISIQNARTYQNAITDRLTNLYNYGYFREQLERMIEEARSDRSTLSLIMFDIDHFKNFNDKNGHDVANVALVGVAALCVNNSRQKGDRVPDLVARYGGEEFMIVLQDVTKEAAYQSAERIRQLVESTQFEGGQNQPMGKVTISMGVSSFPEDADNSEELINQADQALYKAKRSGRNNVQLAG
jgi:diguanylate cyclase (GGDEF)-like protein